MNLSSDEKAKLCNRLRRIGGQVDAIARMIDDDEYCVDILLQLSAATGALSKVGQIVLEHHIKTCIRDAMAQGRKKDLDQKIEELIAVVRRFADVAD